ncbi:MAG: TolB family protein [Anaerolineae bacterium]
MPKDAPTRRRSPARFVPALLAALAVLAALYAWQSARGTLFGGGSRMLYLAPNEAGMRQIVSLSTPGGTPMPLTDEPLGVWDFALSPNGASIAYAALRADEGSDLVFMDANGGNRRALTHDPAVSSSGAVWLPAGATDEDSGPRLVYQRQPWADGFPTGDPELWTLDPVAGATEPLGAEQPLTGSDARVSADGQWLAYLSASGSEIITRNLRDGRTRTLGDATGLPVSWHPQRNVFLASRTGILDEGLVISVVLVNPEADTVTPLASSDWTEHSVPGWSADGERIALAAVPLGSARAIARQLWIMQGVDGEAQTLTNDAGLRYGAPVWSPDGRYLAYERRLRGDLTSSQSLWLLDLETGEERQLAEAGALPVWVR